MAETCCPICVENFNLSTKAPIRCPNSTCEYTACKECTRTYILSITKEPCCMQCNSKFSSDFCVLQLNRSFMEKEYKQHRKKLLLDREMSKLPETMNIAQHHQTMEKLEAENIEYKKEIAELRSQINKIEEKRNYNATRIYGIKNGKSKEETAKFIMPCPDESCRGYLSTAYKCGLCKLYTCPKCLEVIGESKTNPEHTCDEEKVKTAEFIKNTTKACPGCGERIYKVEGCDQMWCTSCHVAFSWKTGIIDNGTIHNPHFYQYQRNNLGAAPRNPQDFHCGGAPNWWQIRRRILQVTNNQSMLTLPLQLREHINETIELYQRMHRAVTHITHVSLRETRRKIQEFSDFQNIRVSYILNRISKDEMGKVIVRKDNLRRKYVELVHIYELLSIVGIDCTRSLAEYVDNKKKDKEKWTNGEVYTDIVGFMKDKIDEFNKLRIYCNSQLEVISNTYNQSVTELDENFNIRSKKYSTLTAMRKKQKGAEKKENAIVGAANVS